MVSRNGREPLSNVQITVESLGLNTKTDKDGQFTIENLPQGNYTLLFSTPDFEPLQLLVRADRHMKDLKAVIMVPANQHEAADDSVFAEFDSDSSSSDAQALPSSLSSSKDRLKSIASFRLSEMSFTVRVYDSQ